MRALPYTACHQAADYFVASFFQKLYACIGCPLAKECSPELGHVFAVAAPFLEHFRDGVFKQLRTAQDRDPSSGSLLC